MNRAALSAIFNPEDLNALEMALQIKERHGGTVTVITMGPPKAANILRESLWRGADKVVLLTDRRFAGADTLATSLALQKAIEKLGRYDLILAGRQAIDGDTAQVGPQTAEKLGIPQITYAESVLEIADGRITAQRALDSGSEIVRCQMPCLLTVVGSANTPRPPSVRRRIARKLAATSGEYAALQKRWPEFETAGGARGVPERPRPRDPGLDGGRHRRHRREHRSGRLAHPGPQDQLRGPGEHREQDGPAHPRGHRGHGGGAGPRVHRRVGGHDRAEEHLGIHRAHGRPDRRREPGADRQGPRPGRSAGLRGGGPAVRARRGGAGPGRHPPRRRPRPAGRPSGAGPVPHPPLRPRGDQRGAQAQAGDLPGRRHAQRPGLRAARRQRPALRPDRRLHGPADRRLLRQARGQDVQEPAVPDPAGLRREPGRHDRQSAHAAPDGHGPRGGHAHARRGLRAGPGSWRR